jgi:hypothetical protein
MGKTRAIMLVVFKVQKLIPGSSSGPDLNVGSQKQVRIYSSAIKPLFHVNAS